MKALFVAGAAVLALALATDTYSYCVMNEIAAGISGFERCSRGIATAS